MRDDYGKAIVKPHPAHNPYTNIYGPIFESDEELKEDDTDIEIIANIKPSWMKG